MKYSLVLLLGGVSKRFNQNDSNKNNKVYYIFNDKPLFMYSLEKFLNDSDFDDYVLVTNPRDVDYLKETLNEYNILSKVTICNGGLERYLSVINGLYEAKNDYVFVHDGARPNINFDDINKLKEGLKNNLCVTLANPVTETIKEVKNGKVTTIDRNNLYTIKTPQATKKDLLLNCLLKVDKEDFITDDLGAIEKYSDVTPLIICGSERNIKVTTKDDIELLKVFMEDC